MLVYPNPATDQITVSLPGDADALKTYAIVAADGRVLEEKVISQSQKEARSILLDIRGLSNGSYSIKVTGQNKFHYIQFFKLK